MPLDPRARQFLDSLAALGLPPLHEVSVAQARRQMDEASAGLGRPAPVAQVTDRDIEAIPNSIRLRIYQPEGQNLPVVIYYHGGGWVLGGLLTHDGYCRALAQAAQAVVISVDYHLAPEHPFPAAAEDAYAALRWAAEHCTSYGGHPGKLVVAGDSAGGNLAAVTPLMARDRNGPSLACQVLLYPITDCDLETPSYQEFATGYYLTRDSMRWFWDQYCPRAEDRTHPYLSPMRAESLAGLPPALVITAEFDPLRDEGEAYAERLREAGVETTLSRYDGVLHGFTRQFRLFPQAAKALEETARFLKQHCH
ncbi:alpha/beta hydrolase [Lignipirellula cremea]|uniref:Carboxylesterase NlhH n=1 Tax=Lignipirellula cremea TaxID=2528010 RepID=A0A518E2M0_9BACT|nr:alpha/beta hydrolase [Lignipirellula cremea]QDU98335.1 Carboxylesterase NlhH [Lignipirellula cremea]